MFNLRSNLAGFLALVLAGASPQSTPNGGPARPPVHANEKRDVKSPRRDMARKRASRSTTLHPDSKPTTSQEQQSPVSIPVLPMSPEELPARAPHVKYREGRLFVDSNNSTLAEILNAIHQETGVQIETLSGAGGDRVAVHLSGSPRSVVSSLLDGAKFGYIIVSPAEDPEGILKVVVTSQTQGESRSEAARPPERGRPAGSTVEPSPATEYGLVNTIGASAELGAASSALPALTQPPAQNSSLPPGPSGGLPADDQGATNSASGDAPRSADPALASPNADSNQTAKTPTQLLQELYRQRQQLQPQNQTPKPQPGVSQ